MMFDAETVQVLVRFLAGGGAIGAIAKVSREASADRLRQRLQVLEIELFETARALRMLRHPAVVLLNFEIRRAVEEASAIHWRRWTWNALRRSPRSVPVLGSGRTLEEALDRVRDPAARATVECVCKRARSEVRAHLAVGAVPFASAVWGTVTARHAQAGFGIPDGPRLSGGRHHEPAQLPRAA